MEYKKNYSEPEWEKRKEYYVQQVLNINIPVEIDDYNLKRLLSLNNNLLSEAYMDKANVFEKLEKVERKLKVSEEECWATIDWSKMSNTKLIKEEKKAYIISFLKSKADDGSYNIYDMYSILSSRAKFIENVVYTLKDKAGALLNLHSLLKMEKDYMNYIGHSNMNGEFAR